MARCHGWAPCGERCRLAVPLGHRKTTTLTAALRTTGLVATALFEGATNGTRFRPNSETSRNPARKRRRTGTLLRRAAEADARPARSAADLAPGRPAGGVV